MKNLLRLSCIGVLLALPLSTWAFVQTSFEYPQVQSAYEKAVSLEQARLSKISSLSTADQGRLTKAENRLVSALKLLQEAIKTNDATKIKKAMSSAKAASNFFQFTLKSLKNTAQKPSSISSTSSTNEAVSILYYADSFNGGKTSLGDTFSQWTFSSAKCNDPLSSLLEVRSGGKSVVVKLNDRPNCEKHPDIADLSKVAFESLAPISRGKISGDSHSLWVVEKGYKKSYLAMDTFSSLGLVLDEKIPNTYKLGESIRVSASIQDGKTDAVFFIKTPSGKKISLSQSTKNGKVTFYQPLDEVGKYELIMASGMGFSTTKMENIYVLSDTIFAAKTLSANSDSLAKLDSIEFTRQESWDFAGINILALPSDTYRENTVTLSAGDKKITRSAMGNIAFLPTDFATFSGETDAKIVISSARASTPFSLDVYETPKIIFEKTLPLVSSYTNSSEQSGNVTTKDGEMTVYLQTPKDTAMRPIIYLITPSGRVKESSFSREYIGDDGYLVRGKTISAKIPLEEKGQYIVEIMYSTGFPAFNMPVSHGTDTIAVLPNEYDSLSKDTKSDIENAQNVALKEINKLRKKIGEDDVSLDPKLTQLAQYKVQDMASHNYVGHVDSYGKTIGDTAKRAGIQLSGSIGENVAGGTVSADFLIAGLSLSGGHRANILGKSWTKLGIGVMEKDGMLYFVEIFGE